MVRNMQGAELSADNQKNKQLQQVLIQYSKRSEEWKNTDLRFCEHFNDLQPNGI